MSFWRLLLCLFSLSCAYVSPAHASAIERLKQFVQQTQSAKGQFTQVVLDKSGKSQQESTGTLVFSRPGKFRWSYDKPYKQLIVGDSKKLWIYDEDLNQVTVKKLDQALGSSPAALLAGSNEIDKAFTLRDEGMRDALEWLEATPKSKDTAFESVRMGFGVGGLAVMQLKDNFGQTTVIRFSRLERNPHLASDLFKFAPPKGADVIGD